MKAAARLIGALALLTVLLLVAFAGWAWVRNHPQDLPWLSLNLNDPIGPFTVSKLVALGGDAPKCERLMREAGMHFAEVPPLRRDDHCGYADAVRLGRGGPHGARFAPDDPVMACRLAAAFAIWEAQVVQPAALANLGARVVRFEHLGSYNCRRIAGRSSWSQHATANGIDIAGFVLADGRSVTLLSDWGKGGDKDAFLHAVRDGGCRLWSTTLSPDYNAAHRNHLHLDMGRWGGFGLRICR